MYYFQNLPKLLTMMEIMKTKLFIQNAMKFGESLFRTTSRAYFIHNKTKHLEHEHTLKNLRFWDTAK